MPRFVCLVLLLILVGCGTSELETQPTFDGTFDAVVVATEDATVLETDAVPGTIVIEIDTGTAAVRGETSCDPFFGSYTLVDEPSGSQTGIASFTIPSPGPSETCTPADQQLQAGVVEALESVTQWEREGSGLRLTSPAGALIVLQNRAG